MVSSGPTFLNQGADVDGGMRVGGGVVVSSGGLAIASDREDAPAVLISYGRERGNILEAESLGGSVLEVAASGKMTVRSGGVKVSPVFPPPHPFRASKKILCDGGSSASSWLGCTCTGGEWRCGDRIRWPRDSFGRPHCGWG